MRARVDVSVLILTREDGRVLVQRRDREPFEGVWEFPGGKVEEGESPEAAALRECREECGLDAADARLLCVVDTDYAPAVRLHAFVARALGEPERGVERRWVRVDELAALEMPPANARIVAALRAREE